MVGTNAYLIFVVLLVRNTNTKDDQLLVLKVQNSIYAINYEDMNLFKINKKLTINKSDALSLTLLLN